MKIEKISDNQISCTLSREELNFRKINIAELAYGSESASSLFREMLSKANREFGFKAEDIPLMIEAVPLPDEKLMLLITKVDDPEELDTRFARFAPLDSAAMDDDDDYAGSEEAVPIRADEMIEQFAKLYQAYPEDADGQAPEAMPLERKEPDFFQVYRFSTIDVVCRASRVLNGVYDSRNTLYKDSSDRPYLLVIHKGDHSPETFNKVCNILSEYGEHVRANAGTEAVFAEHCELILADHAVQALQAI